MDTLWLRNLLEYCAQTILLAAVATLLVRWLRLRAPSARLACWQILLALCLILPAMERWQPAPKPPGRVSVRSVVLEERAPSLTSPTLTAAGFIRIILLAGITLRFGLLALGFARLRRYRLKSTPIPNAFTELRDRLGALADIRVSTEISGPVTFGFRRPVILLPKAWIDNEAIACHELLHVRRQDWPFAVAEECVRAILWFNPAIWWIIAQIQLTREEAVDRSAIALLNSREQYVDALLAMAAAKSGIELAPASPFLRKRHLRTRVASLFHEVSMSKFRLSSALTMLAAAMIFTAWFGARTFSLQATPQDELDAPGVSVDAGGAALLHRPPVIYPHAAVLRGVQGRVTIDATLSDSGAVSDARVISGPIELRKSVLQSVLEWRYEKSASMPATIAINIDFELPKGAPQGSGATVEEQRTSAGRTAPPASGVAGGVIAGVPGGVVGGIPAASPESDKQKRLRVGGNVSAANLITKVQPMYPPAAKQAGIQGTVRLQVVIDKDGKVHDVQLVSGHPLLVNAAEDAVWNWVYKPTLLNGDPVEVLTQVDINFTLSQ